MDTTFNITPMSQYVSLSPGETYEGSVTVVNPVDAKGDFKYKAYVAPYSVRNGSYDADLKELTSWNQMVDWIKIENPTGSVEPNGKKEVKYTIKVPKSAPAGGQYAAIVLGQDNEGSHDGGVTIENVFEMASLVYASIDGETVHKGEVLENKVPGFVTSLPVTLEAKINNEGNIHETATVIVEASNLFTGEVILPSGDNTGEFSEVILPDTTRDIARNLDNLPSVGIVRVKQSIYYRGEVSTEQKDIWICPIWFIVLVAVVIVAIAVGIWRLIVRRKKKKSLTGAVG